MRRWLRIIGAGLLGTVAVVGIVALVVSMLNATSGGVQGNGGEASATAEPDLTQCRVDAIVAYMREQGFNDGDYVIGEENVDMSATELNEAGSASFNSDGVNTREELRSVFESEDPVLREVSEAQVRKYPDVPRETILDADNWEIVQTKNPVQVSGNTGVLNGTIVSMGTRESDAGDGAWIYVNPDTCLVQRAMFTATGAAIPEGTTEKDKPVGFIRVGCTNPGDNFAPPPAKPAMSTQTVQPESPAAVCPPEHPYGTPPVCKDSPERDPAPSGNAPVGGGGNADSGPGPYIPPSQMEQPSSTPRVNPLPPPPAPPAPPTAAPAPAPVPTQDPAPAPAPEPSAPPPSAPETGCDASVPGVVC